MVDPIKNGWRKFSRKCLEKLIYLIFYNYVFRYNNSHLLSNKITLPW